jgi:uncharacterized protein DUF4157
VPEGERIPLEPVARLARRRADATPVPPARDVNAQVLGLQRTHGNRFVSRLLARAAEEGGAMLTPEIEDEIERERGGGAPLGAEVRRNMEASLGADLGGVRVHTGPRADGLSHALNARAFTTGSDVFFRSGAYDPGSSAGRELLAHELTHVVQQHEEPVRPKLELGPADDEYEREANAVASTVVQRWHELPGAVRRQPVPEEEEEPVRLQRVEARVGRRVQRLYQPAAPSTAIRRACVDCDGGAPCAECAEHASPVQRQPEERGRAPPRPETCVPAPGYTSATCGAYRANDWWLPNVYVHNATCACRETPNDPTAMCVRKFLQDRLATTPAATKSRARAMKPFEIVSPTVYQAFVQAVLTPIIHRDHVDAYASCCCPAGPAQYASWIGVTTVPLPCPAVGWSIRQFGSCHGTPGAW